ncbi:MAG: glycogen synthase [Ilumatobacteraceae bacterium]
MSPHCASDRGGSDDCSGALGSTIHHNVEVRITFATAELAPLATVGGLAAAASGLVGALRRAGVEVDVLLPDYGGVELADAERIPLVLPDWAGPGSIRVGEHPIAGRVHLVEVPGIARSHPYLQPDGRGWLDNTERFLRFARAVAAFVESTRPDVAHLNDWHTATALAAIAPGVPSVLSLHNLAHQGATGSEWLEVIGPRGHHYEWWGGMNPLTGAIALADRVVAVSPHHASEILSVDGGFGLDGPLRDRGGAVSGILNGIDTSLWDPASDPALPAPFSVDDPEPRDQSRAALIERLGFADDGQLLAVAVTRLTDQKGIDLLEPVVPLLDEFPMRLAVLGSGERDLADRLGALSIAHSERFAFVEGYDEQLAHLMFAGSDLFVMPSRFEPCGLTQMQAMRYGSIPVVTGVGGLVDTVPDVDAHPRAGRGFVADGAEVGPIISALHRAARRCSDRRRLSTLRRRVMSVDWSWDGPAREYVEIYRQLSRGH